MCLVCNRLICSIHFCDLQLIAFKISELTAYFIIFVNLISVTLFSSCKIEFDSFVSLCMLKLLQCRNLW